MNRTRPESIDLPGSATRVRCRRHDVLGATAVALWRARTDGTSNADRSGMVGLWLLAGFILGLVAISQIASAYLVDALTVQALVVTAVVFALLWGVTITLMEYGRNRGWRAVTALQRLVNPPRE